MMTRQDVQEMLEQNQQIVLEMIQAWQMEKDIPGDLLRWQEKMLGKVRWVYKNVVQEPLASTDIVRTYGFVPDIAQIDHVVRAALYVLEVEYKRERRSSKIQPSLWERGLDYSGR